MTARFPIQPASRSNAAFSLVEVTIAIGIFAFVVVGVLGLLPAGLRLRADSAAETQGVLIAEELFTSIRASSNLSKVVVRDGPKLTPANLVNPPINLIASNSSAIAVLGYPPQTTVPFGLFHSSRSLDPVAVWRDGSLPTWAVNNAINTLARISASSLGNGIYRLTVEVRAPASLPLEKTRPAVFTTLVYSP